MSELSEHFKKIKQITKLYADEVDTMRKDGHLEDNPQLEIDLGMVLFSNEEVLKTFKGEPK